MAAREVGALRTPEVVRVVLAEAGEATRNEPSLAVEWLRFAIQLVDMIPERLFAAEQRRERLGQAYANLGNALRVGGDYQDAGTAIQKASELLNERNVSRAQLLSFHSSLTYDMGDIPGAVELLNQGQQIYTELRDRSGIARLGIQHANFLRELQPAEARWIAEQTLLLVPRTEPRLEMLARCVIAECHADEHDGEGALVKLEEARPHLRQFQEPWVDTRTQLLEARILEELEYIADAERLYAEVARLLWFREMYRECFIVRLRLVEFYLGRKRVREAAEVCRKAVNFLSETNAHTQMKEVWQTLFETVEADSLKGDALPNLRHYMVLHWRVPAEHTPAIAA